MRHPLSTEALIDWLERQPPTKPYSYRKSTDCLLFRYLSFAGLSPRSVGPWFWMDTELRIRRLPKGWEAIAGGSLLHDVLRDGGDMETTYGSALKRASRQLEWERA